MKHLCGVVVLLVCGAAMPLLNGADQALDLSKFILDENHTPDRKVTLQLMQTKVTDADLQQLSGDPFKTVEVIDLYDTKISDAGLVWLKGLSISGLSLHSTRVTDEGLQLLKGLPLKSLSLGYCNITDRGLAALSGMKLESLMLARTQVTDDGLARLQQLPLKSLNLVDLPISDAGLEHLRGLKLTQLELTGRGITDAGLSSLSAMPLTSLGLFGTQVTDKGLKALSQLPLQFLWLNNSRVTDEGLKILKGIKTLKVVYALGTRVTREGAKSLDRVDVYLGDEAPKYKRYSLSIFLSTQQIEEAEKKEGKDAFAATNFTTQGFIRAQAKPRAVELRCDPRNIGLPFYSNEVVKLTQSDEGYSGTMTFDFYPKPETPKGK